MSRGCEACGHKPSGTVRVICPHCRTPNRLTDALGQPGAQWWRCESCGLTFGQGQPERREGSRAVWVIGQARSVHPDIRNVEGVTSQ